MNENLDLTKILDGCPAGTEFYHLIFGQVALREIIDGEYPIIVEPIINTTRSSLTKDGRLNDKYDGECLLYPSKYKRDWSKFVRFWDKPKTEESTVEMFDENTLKPFDKVLARDYLNDNWMADFFEKIEENDIYYNVTCVTCKWVQCIPYNEETEHLLGTTNDCPEYYKWWEE